MSKSFRTSGMIKESVFLMLSKSYISSYKSGISVRVYINTFVADILLIA